MDRRGPAAAILASVLLAAAVRLPLFWTAASTPSADEAVFGLMAMKILRGEDLPAFCWGAHYAGALVSYVAAALFAVLGVGPHVLRLSTLPFALGAPAVGAALGGRLAGTAGAWTVGLLLAVPPPVFALYSVSVLGGHTETYLFGLLLLLLAERLAAAADAGRPTRGAAAALGAASGIGLWILVAVAPFLLAALARLGRRRPPFGRDGGIFVAALLAGLSPAIAYNVVHPLATFRRGAGRSVAASAFDRLHLIAAPVLFLGGGVLGLLLLILFVAALVRAVRRHPHLGLLLAAQIVLLVAMGLGRERHMGPLWASAAVGVAVGTRGRARAALVAACLAANLWGLSGLYRQRGEDFGPLIGRLRAAGVTRLATDYNVAYPVVFLTEEAIIASPVAGPDRTDRWPPYTAEVLRARRFAVARRASDTPVILSLP